MISEATIGNAVKASRPSMLGARKPVAALPSPRFFRPAGPVVVTALTSTGITAMVVSFQERSWVPALGRHPLCVRSLARRLSLAEEAVAPPLAVVRGDGLLGEGGHDLLPGRSRGVRKGALKGRVHDRLDVLGLVALIPGVLGGDQGGVGAAGVPEVCLRLSSYHDTDGLERLVGVL